MNELVLNAGSTHGETVHFQGRLPDTHGDTLAIFATGAYSGIKGKIITDHADAGQDIGTVADQGGAFNGAGQLTVLDEIGFAR